VSATSEAAKARQVAWLKALRRGEEPSDEVQDRLTVQDSDAVLDQMQLIGFLGKSTRMLFNAPSRSNPSAYIAVYAFEELDEDRT
jgi:hypothetical protein